jgi:predicted metal-binding membrane protein
MGMAASMAVMMVPTAAPFFIAYGRDSRRPLAIAALVVIYLVVWAAIGAAVGMLMNQVMQPPSQLITAAAIVFAGLYAIAPWSRWARARCSALCRPAVRGDGVRDALTDASAYTVCCIVCSAGVMVVLAVIGMSNVLALTAGAAALLLYKVI